MKESAAAKCVIVHSWECSCRDSLTDFPRIVDYYSCKLSELGSSEAIYAISFCYKYQVKPLVTPVCSAYLQQV